MVMLLFCILDTIVSIDSANAKSSLSKLEEPPKSILKDANQQTKVKEEKRRIVRMEDGLLSREGMYGKRGGGFDQGI